MKAITPTKDELQAAFATIWRNDESMVKHCMKKVDTAVYLSDGSIYYTEKEYIKKDFCFGYSDSDRDTEDYDRANDMARYAMENEEYFRDKNLSGCIDKYNKIRNARYLYAHARYMGDDDTEPLFVCLLPLNEPIELAMEYNRWINRKLTYKLVSNEDRRLILQANQEHIKHHTKRINTYLKKYGLSKVNAWSYWQDE